MGNAPPSETESSETEEEYGPPTLEESQIADDINILKRLLRKAVGDDTGLDSWAESMVKDRFHLRKQHPNETMLQYSKRHWAEYVKIIIQKLEDGIGSLRLFRSAQDFHNLKSPTLDRETRMLLGGGFWCITAEAMGKNSEHLSFLRALSIVFPDCYPPLPFYTSQYRYGFAAIRNHTMTTPDPANYDVDNIWKMAQRLDLTKTELMLWKARFIAGDLDGDMAESPLGQANGGDEDWVQRMKPCLQDWELERELPEASDLYMYGSTEPMEKAERDVAYEKLGLIGDTYSFAPGRMWNISDGFE